VKRSLLLVRLSAIGDAVHTLPALELLRAALPGWKLGWAVEAEAAPIVEHARGLDAVHVIDRRALGRARGRTGTLRSLGRLVRSTERYDVAVDFQGLARSALVARLFARRVLGSRHARELATLAYHVKLDAPAASETHAVRRFTLLARSALAALGEQAPERVPAPRLEVPVSTLALEEPFLALLPGAGKPANQPPVALLAAVARRLPELAFVTVGGPRDREAGTRLARLVGARDLTGRLSLVESASVLARAAVVLGGDTGPLHVARALGRPTVALFFAADPARTAPAGYPGDAPALVVRGGAPCAPCLARTCRRPDKVRICLEPLDPGQIAAAVRAALSGTLTGAPA
jgi:lipopolysaccharide heptosyltransferase I